MKKKNPKYISLSHSLMRRGIPKSWSIASRGMEMAVNCACAQSRFFTYIYIYIYIYICIRACKPFNGRGLYFLAGERHSAASSGRESHYMLTATSTGGDCNYARFQIPHPNEIWILIIKSRKRLREFYKDELKIKKLFEIKIIITNQNKISLSIKVIIENDSKIKQICYLKKKNVN